MSSFDQKAYSERLASIVAYQEAITQWVAALWKAEQLDLIVVRTDPRNGKTQFNAVTCQEMQRVHEARESAKNAFLCARQFLSAGDVETFESALSVRAGGQAQQSAGKNQTSKAEWASLTDSQRSKNQSDDFREGLRHEREAASLCIPGGIRMIGGCPSSTQTPPNSQTAKPTGTAKRAEENPATPDQSPPSATGKNKPIQQKPKSKRGRKPKVPKYEEFIVELKNSPDIGSYSTLELAKHYGCSKQAIVKSDLWKRWKEVKPTFQRDPSRYTGRSGAPQVTD